MLSVLDQVVAAARVAGVPVSLCGEAASRPLEALVADVRERGHLDFRRSGGMSLREPISNWAREQGITT